MKNILLTIPFGSRLYGTFDENSDWDWKMVILPKLEDLLIGRQIKNQFFASSDNSVKNTSEDTDTELVPIQIFAKDVLEGQTYALEILFAVIASTPNRMPVDGMVVHDARFRGFCNELLDRFLTSNINAMVGYAYNQAQIYSDKGNRLDKLHQFDRLLADCQAGLNLTENDKLGLLMAKGAANYKQMVDKMFYLTESPNPDGTSQTCFSLLEKLYPDGITIAEARKRVQAHIKKYGRRANEAMENTGKDWKAISHAVRVTYEALEVLTLNWIELPFPPKVVDQLKAIKYGQVEWEVVEQTLLSNIDKIAQLQIESDLPPNSPQLRAEFDEWLKVQMTQFYGVDK